MQAKRSRSQDVQLLPVSKNHPAANIELYKAVEQFLAENYVSGISQKA